MRMPSLPIAIAFFVACVCLGGCIVTVGLWMFWPRPPLEGQIEMSLPGSPTVRDDLDRDVEADVVVKVISDLDKGSISSVVLKTPKKTTEIAGQNWRKTLVEALKQARPASTNDAVKIEADSKLKWANLVEVMDACKEAGFTNVGFAPPPD
jgi:biopolymer transport protein ExbD